MFATDPATALVGSPEHPSENQSDTVAPVKKWIDAAQQTRHLLSSSGVLKQSDSLTSLCSTIESLPAVAAYPDFEKRQKQQQAFEQLLVLLPQLLLKLLGQRPAQWLQVEQFYSSIRSALMPCTTCAWLQASTTQSVLPQCR
jgi:hypothetical protein